MTTHPDANSLVIQLKQLVDQKQAVQLELIQLARDTRKAEALVSQLDSLSQRIKQIEKQLGLP